MFSLAKVRSVLVGGMAACVVMISAVWPLGPGIASVAAAGVDTPAAPAARDPHQRLERLLKREQTVLVNEGSRLTRMGSIANRIQTYIDAQAAKGKDVSKLQTALSDFRRAISTAQSDYDAAQATLDAMAGFDADGRVVDVAQARTTVRTAAKDERRFRQTLRKGLVNLRNAVRECRQDNRASSTR